MFSVPEYLPSAAFEDSRLSAASASNVAVSLVSYFKQGGQGLRQREGSYYSPPPHTTDGGRTPTSGVGVPAALPVPVWMPQAH